MPTVVDLALADAHAVPLLEDGRHNLEIFFAERRAPKSDDSARHLILGFNSLDEPESDTLYEYLGEPKNSDRPDIAMKKRNRMRECFECFKIDTTVGFEVEDDPEDDHEGCGPVPSLIGKSGWVVTTVEESRDPQYDDKARITEFLKE